VSAKGWGEGAELDHRDRQAAAGPRVAARKAAPREGRGARKPGSSAAVAPGNQTARPPAAALRAPGVADRRALLLVTMLLLLYGLVMAYSASSAQAFFQYGSSFHFAGRQVVFALLGLAAMWLLSRVDYAWYRRLAFPLAGIALAGLVLVLIPGIGVSVNGARRWIMVGGQGLQPSELAKLAAVILVATLIARHPLEITRLRHLLLLVAVGIVPAVGLIMLEPDLGSTVVLIGAVLALLIAGGARLRHLIALIAVGFLAVLVLIVIEPYRLERLLTFFDPWKDAQGSGFQATQSLISVASGGFFGVGLGNSVQKFGFLPEQGTDMITGIIGEELGLMGLLGLIALYCALAWVCFRIAMHCKEPFGKLLATGVTAIVIGQAIINIGAALGVLPLTGVPLPLVSLGGTSLVVVLAGLGILLNIATNRRSFIVASPQRSMRPVGRGGDRRTPAADPRRRG
jgi:cell division protein FtsW